MIIVIILAVLVTYGNYLSKSLGDKAAKKFLAIELKYEDFVNQYFNRVMINPDKENFRIDDVLNKVMVVLKPDIDSLWFDINQNTFSGVKISHKSRLFSNLISISELYFEKHYKNQRKFLGQDDENRFFQALEDAIKSDLIRRANDLIDLD